MNKVEKEYLTNIAGKSCESQGRNMLGSVKANITAKQDSKQQNRVDSTNNLKKVLPMSDETIRKAILFPLSNEMLHNLGVLFEINKFIENFKKDFETYLEQLISKMKPYIEFKNYPLLLSVTNDRIKYLVDNVPIGQLKSHSVYYSYTEYGDGLEEKRPKQFFFTFPRKTDIAFINDLIKTRYGDIHYTCSTNTYMFHYVNETGDYVHKFDTVERHLCYDIRVCKVEFSKGYYLSFFLTNGFIPLFADDESLQKKYTILLSLYDNNYLNVDDSISLNPAKLSALQSFLKEKDYLREFTNFDLEQIASSVKEQDGALKNIMFENRLADIITNELLTYDSIRADITEYDPMMLEDPNRGSWELWDAPYQTDNLITLPNITYYARDPRMDIVDGGVIGIDFGTKSTVVVAQDDSDRIAPMRVGMGRYEKAATGKDYENPTVMEFINIDDFIDAYNSGIGRPLTKWSDMTSSHTAYNDWQNNDKSEFYFSFFGELKQWAGDSDRRIRIRDQQGKDISLPPYDELQDGEFDPIELYAYFIGLYINNMHNRRIYMEYLLSFPVTYSLETRKRILESFRKGLSRSLPQTILGDPECMKQFIVEEGVGEPAAYAVCALQSYKLQPKENENVVYGVFDFGGGTTDFDFGIWRKAKGPKERRYRNVIEHFGDGGDKFLGGENLLELLAFEVFKENQDVLRNSEITFYKPPECDRFPGSEILLADSQEAQTNMRQLIERLRSFWERTADYEKEYSSGVIKLRLFNYKGEVLNNFELKMSVKKLEGILQKRIKKGVDSFFDALYSNYKKPAYAELLKKTTKIHIFLAGNSSKSVILKDIFKQAVDEYKSKIQKQLESKIETDSLIEIYPPLGTEEAKNKFKELGIDSQNSDTLDSPTGKTGVAIGLIQCRKGAKIKVVSETKTEEEIKFRYWVGDTDDDGYFVFYLNRDCEYNAWKPYYDAGENRFEFYYTTSTTAERTRGLLVSEAKKSRQKLPANAVNEDWMIYLRAVSPDTIEFAVAENDEAVRKNIFKYGPIKVELK